MKPEFTNTGVQVQTFEDIFADLAQGYRDIYGQDIDLSQNTPDGQRVGIEAQARLDMQSFGLALANSLDPDFNDGRWQQMVAKICGIKPRPGTRSQWDLVVTANRSLTLPVGYIVQDDNGNNWVLNDSVTVVSGDNTVTFRAEEFGDVAGVTGSVFAQITIVLGVTGIRADIDAVVGRDEETSNEFRVRRNRSLENPAYSTIGALVGKIAALPGVTDVNIGENNTGTLDAATGIPANHIWVIVENGAVSDIAETMVKQKTAGSGMKGSVTAVYTENVLLPSGTIFHIIHTVMFDRPRYTDLYVTLTTTRKDTLVPIDIDTIKTQIAARKFSIGESIQAAMLYMDTFTDTDAYIVTDMKISDDNAVFTDGLLSPDLDEKYQIKVANITVTEAV